MFFKKILNINIFIISVVSVLLFVFLSTGYSKDTDIYKVNVKQNCYMLMDNSGSMDFGVYEHTIDYGAMFDYLFDLNDGGTGTYIADTINNNASFYNNHHPKNKIFLWKGAIGLTKTSIDGENVSFTGDAANPDYLWYSDDLVDTHTIIDNDGNLSPDGSGNTQRLTVDSDGYILFDGEKLPLGQDIKLHDFKSLYDGTLVDNGFGGLLNAPGYYFSGYKGVNSGNLNTADDGDTDIYFFVTGNWANMQAMYNLHYETNNPDPQGASTGDPAWKYELFPIAEHDWTQINVDEDVYQYPLEDGVEYENNLDENETTKSISHPGAKQIQVYFSEFDVEGDNQPNQWKNDYVVLKNSSGSDVKKYDNDNNPTSGDGWSPTISGDTVKISLASNNSVTKTGYKIDKIRITYTPDSYLMQNRMDVAKDAMLYVLDEFKGKINWGFASYKSCNGATLNHSLNPSSSDDENSNSIKTAVSNLSPDGGTPLGEALQDVFESGYYGKRNSLDNLMCRKNYIISVTDGFPSCDTDWSRINGTTITDSDGDGWTSDPYQPNLADNYYDDVASWIYNHSWLDKTLVSDPANSYENVITHHISFGSAHPLLEEAAGDSGGQYIAAYNKSQLVSAFYALGLEIAEAVSFTSPVVSVDAENKIQSGDDLYLGLFLPKDNKSWVGNIKKFKLGDGSTDRPDKWMLYDASNNEVINSDGDFMDNTDGFWGDENDANDSDNYGASDVTEDGVGEVMKEKVDTYFTNENYWNRPIYTYDSSAEEVIEFSHSNITNSDLNVGSDLERYKVINYTYGYTFDSNADKTPAAVRDWVMGSVLHSQPVVINYYDLEEEDIPLDKRYVAVGSNDGMLHVFDDSTGEEVFSFIPDDLLSKLKLIPETPFVDTVDGHITLYNRDKSPKYLIFGERRGGEYFWCIDISDKDPANWAVEWKYTNSEISQSWSKPEIASVPVSVDSTTGEMTFKDVVIVTGGYDSEEDNYPEPFDDLDGSGSPYKTSGGIDNKEWDKNNADHDINGNKSYDIANTGMNETGRGVFIFDIDDPENSITAGSTQILPFSVQYGSSDVTTGISQTLSSMKYCFPASPSVVRKNYSYSSGDTINRESDLLQSVYAIDVYANLFKINFDFDVRENSGSYSLTDPTWKVTKIFSANPGSLSASGNFGAGENDLDKGRKAFYPPAVSLGGSCNYFDKGNYKHQDLNFSGTNDIATVFFGTGDREHPQYTMIDNRFYAVYDDSSVTAENKNTSNAVTVSTVPYKEDDLLNLSCDELEEATTLSGVTKAELMDYLTDDAVYDNSGTSVPEDGTNEDDAKGWYIILKDQGDTTECSHCSYPNTFSPQDHNGEKILSKPSLYAETLYFTSYQPSVSDPCNPQGNGFTYDLNYCDATAGESITSYYDDSIVPDVTHRYNKISNIFGLPSSFSIITRDGEGAALSMMGGKIIGPDDGGFQIKTSPLGIDFYYWREKSFK